MHLPCVTISQRHQACANCYITWLHENSLVMQESAIAVLSQAFDCGAILDFQICEFKDVWNWGDVQCSCIYI